MTPCPARCGGGGGGWSAPGGSRVAHPVRTTLTKAMLATSATRASRTRRPCAWVVRPLRRRGSERGGLEMVSAIDRDHRAGDVAREFGAEEGDDVGHVAGIAEAGEDGTFA